MKERCRSDEGAMEERWRSDVGAIKVPCNKNFKKER